MAQSKLEGTAVSGAVVQEDATKGVLQALQSQLVAFETLYQLALDMHQLDERQAVFQFVADKLQQTVAVSSCSVVVSNAGSAEFSSHAGVDIEQSERANLLSDCSKFAQAEVVNQTAVRAATSNALLVPVCTSSKIFAVLVVRGSAEHLQFWQPLLEKFAGIVTRKLLQLADRQRLQQSIEQLEYASQLQKVLFNIASLQYDGDAPQLFYQKLQENVATLMYARNFFIAILDTEKGYFHFPYFVDEHESISPSQYYPQELMEHSLTGYVFRIDQPLLADKRKLMELDEQQVTRAYGVTPECWLGVPFKQADQVAGVLVVQSYDDSVSYQQADVELLQFVCQHISSALARAFVQQRLIHQALHDSLTGLPNRVLFIDRVHHAFSRRRRQPDAVVAIAYLDLDRFKMVNDTLGHQVGDEFLIAVAKRLKSCLRQNDTLARLGGDEFAILLEDVQVQADVAEVVSRIERKLATPVEVGIHRLQTSASIGVAMADVANEIQQTDELIRRADIAMYQAKQDGRGTSRYFNLEMDQQAVRHYQLEMELKQALQQGQFQLHFQPLIDLKTDDTIGFEALIRWQHPIKGTISPAEFIPLAEELGLMGAIDHHVLELAVQQIQHWRFDYATAFYVSVNISGASFSKVGFAESVTERLQALQIPAHFLAIEITEQALIQNIAQAKASIDLLRQVGVRILLDDFGTGYSSLSYLHEFSLDVLKIDRSFVAGIRPRVQENAVINTIIALAKTLKLKVIAEGIETSLQRQLLTDLGCDAAQGYWFAKPLEPKEAAGWLR